MSEEEFIVFSHDPGRDPDGSKFRGVLEAHQSFERARARRAFLLQVLVMVTLVLAFQLASRASFPHWLDRLVHLAWAVTLSTFGLTSFSEWRWRAERARRLADLEQPAR
jgi:hypothetical protein